MTNLIELDTRGYEYKKWKIGNSIPLRSGICNIKVFPNDTFPCHWHDGVEIISVVDGEIEHTVNGERYIMRKGDVMFVNSGSIHGIRITDAGHGYYYAISFLTGFLAPESNGIISEKYFGDIMSSDNLPLLFISSDDEKSQKITQICTEVSNLQAESDGCHEIHIKAELLRLWGILYGEAIKKKPCGSSDIAVQRIKNAVKYIEDNYQSKIGVDDIALACKTGRSELYRSFTRVMRRPPIDYVIDLKIRKSIELLEAGMSVTEVAMATGFSDSSYYTKMFKRYIGCTPKEYVKNKR